MKKEKRDMGKGGIQVTRLINLSDYQEGSIVSRTSEEIFRSQVVQQEALTRGR